MSRPAISHMSKIVLEWWDRMEVLYVEGGIVQWAESREMKWTVGHPLPEVVNQIRLGYVSEVTIHNGSVRGVKIHNVSPGTELKGGK